MNALSRYILCIFSWYRYFTHSTNVLLYKKFMSSGWRVHEREQSSRNEICTLQNRENWTVGVERMMIAKRRQQPCQPSTAILYSRSFSPFPSSFSIDQDERRWQIYVNWRFQCLGNDEYDSVVFFVDGTGEDRVRLIEEEEEEKRFVLLSNHQSVFFVLV